MNPRGKSRERRDERALPHDRSRPLGEIALNFVRSAFTELPEDYDLNGGDIQAIATSVTDLMHELPQDPRTKISPITTHLRVNKLLEGGLDKEIQAKRRKSLTAQFPPFYLNVIGAITNSYGPKDMLVYLDSEITRIRSGLIFEPKAELPIVLFYDGSMAYDETIAFNGKITPVLQRKHSIG